MLGRTTSQPFASPDVRGPNLKVIEGYSGRALYVGTKIAFLIGCNPSGTTARCELVTPEEAIQKKLFATF
jgi:hypothetical protein